MQLVEVVVLVLVVVLVAECSIPGSVDSSCSVDDSATSSVKTGHTGGWAAATAGCPWPILPTNYYMGIAVPPSSESVYRYYLATNTHLTWASALERCRCMGLELTSIDSQEQFLYLNRLIAASSVSTLESFWTSGNDRAQEGRYTWANNGQHFTAGDFLPPGSGQPDDDSAPGPPQDCVSLRKVFPGQPNPVTKAEWIMNDESCTDSELLYICREKL